MIASALFYIETSREKYCRQILENGEFSSGLEFHHSDLTDEINFSKMLTTKSKLGSEINEYKLNKYLRPNYYSPYYTFDQSLFFLNQTDDNSVIGFDFDESILEYCVEGSRLPAIWNETIIISQNSTFPDINDTIKVSFPFYPPFSTVPKLFNNSITVSGVIAPSSLKDSNFIEELSIESNYCLLTTITNYNSLIQEIRDNLLDHVTVIWISETVVHFPFEIDQSSLKNNNVVDFVGRLDEYLTSKKHWRKFFYIEDIIIRIPQDFNTLHNQLEKTNTALAIIFVFIIPIFLLAFLLVSFSNSLNIEKQKKSLILLKMRGFSNRFVFLILTLETTFLAVLAFIFGITLGIPFSALMENIAGISDNSSIASLASITPFTIQMILFGGSIFTMITVLPSAFRLSRISVVSLAEESSRKKTQRFDIFKGNLDIILLTQGILGIFVFSWLLSAVDISTVSINIFLLILLLVFLSPFAILGGLLFFYNRFIPVIINRIGNFFWKKDWRLLSVVSRNLYGNITTTKRITLLIAISISFLMVLSISSSTITQNRINQFYDQVGCDLVISVTGVPGDDIQNLKTQLEMIPGLNTTEVCSSTWEVYDATLRVRTIQLQGIDYNFNQIAFWPSYYDNNSLEQLVTSIFNSSRQHPAIIDSRLSQENNIETGDRYQVYKHGGMGVLRTFHVQGITNNWPGIIDRSNEHDRYLIVPNQILTSISNEGIRRNIWCKISKNYQSVIDQSLNIVKQFGIHQNNINAPIDQIKIDSASLGGIIGVVNIITVFNFIAAIILVSIVIIFFTYVRTTSHAVEIGLSRALGMKYKQVFLLLFTEPLVIFILSGVPGAIIGSILLIACFNIFSALLGQGLPYILYFDIPTLTLIFGWILIVILFSGLFSSLLATRANVSKILKVE